MNARDNGPKSLKVTPYSPCVGAVIEGIDLREPVSDDALQQMRAALSDHGVIFIRNQQITPEQHIAFAKRWAPIDINRFFAAVPGYPEIAQVLKEPEQKTNIGGGWHTDHSYDLVPAMGSMLLAKETPSSGGDTLFANMAAAFDALSPGLQRTLRTMRAVHSSKHVFGERGGYAKQAELKGRIGNVTKATLHGARRLMHRITVQGSAIQGSALVG